MDVEPWKLMLGLAGFLVVFAVVVTVLETTLVAALVLLVLLGLSVFFGYRLGRRFRSD